MTIKKNQKSNNTINPEVLDSDVSMGDVNGSDEGNNDTYYDTEESFNDENIENDGKNNVTVDEEPFLCVRGWRYWWQKLWYVILMLYKQKNKM